MLIENFLRQYQGEPNKYRKSRVLFFEVIFRILAILFIMIFAQDFLPKEMYDTIEFYLLGISGIVTLGISLTLNTRGNLLSASILSIFVNHYILTCVFLLFDVANFFFFWAGFYLVTVLLATLYFNYIGVTVTSIITGLTIAIIPFIEYNISLRDYWLFLIFFVITSTMIIFSIYHSELISSNIAALIHRNEYLSKMESLGRLTGGVAHDFNNILMTIKSETEFLEEELERVGSQKSVENIQLSIDKASEIVNQLLVYSKQQPAQKEGVINLNQYLEGIEYLIKSILGDRIKLVTDYTDEILYVNMNKDRLLQIFINLADNSTDAITDEGYFKIKTRTANKEDLIEDDFHEKITIDVQELIEITVKDNGKGIERSVVSNVFDPFYTTKEVDKGTGLGLSTVYGIIKKANGMISVESTEGKNTIFKIYLPKVEPPEKGIVEKAPRLTSDFLNYTILIVEDNKPLNDSITKMFQRKNADVVVAYDGEEALNKLRDNKNIDLILSDIRMPKMTGLELYQEVPSTFQDKFILMTGYSSVLEDKDGFSHLEVLIKPFSTEELFQIVSKILE